MNKILSRKFLKPFIELNKTLRLFKSVKQVNNSINKQNNITHHEKKNNLKNMTTVAAKKNSDEINELIKPLTVEPSNSDDNVGEEICGKLDKNSIVNIIRMFALNEAIKKMAFEINLTENMFHEVVTSFRLYCVKSKSLPADLHIKLFDIINQNGNLTDIFPYFYRHAKDMYPHLLYLDDLKKISDLREPAYWFPEARAVHRRVIYHAGPTNSGKTYSALLALQEAKSGIYCGPLKLLATEVAQKINKIEPKCDLLTGDNRKYVKSVDEPGSHAACTIEMANINTEFDVAVIDEIQMISDAIRGYAWTRAFLGLRAKEIHICGDTTAIGLIERMCEATGDTFEVKRYERLTPLTILDEPLGDLQNVQPGDCIVCFSKMEIFAIADKIAKLGYQVAVIYGAMPPELKIQQSKRFNDPNDPCKILVATDAIGMGLNLNIKRIIFNSLKKLQQKETQNKADELKPYISSHVTKDYLTTSQVLQIAGRAGRFNTQHSEGYVTTLFKEDLYILKEIIGYKLEPLTKGGLSPTADHIELFSFHLPKHTLSNLLDIFVSICQIDNSKYYLCSIDENKYLADLIEQIPLNIRDRYTFVLAPITQRSTFVCSVFVKFVRMYSNNEPITDEDLCKMILWPVKEPKTVEDLGILETTFDVLDLYLWLSYRFPLMFPCSEQVIEMRKELNTVIYRGLKKIVKHDKLNTKHKIKGIENFEKKETNERIQLHQKKEIKPINNKVLNSSFEENINNKENSQIKTIESIFNEDNNNNINIIINNKISNRQISNVKQKITSSGLLNLLSNKTLEIQKENNAKMINNNDNVNFNENYNHVEKGEEEEVKNDNEITNEESDNEIEEKYLTRQNDNDKRIKIEIFPKSKTYKNNIQYTKDMEYLFVELIKKNLLKDKIVQRIIQEKGLEVELLTTRY